MKIYFRYLVLVAFLLSNNQIFPGGFLKASGKKIVDGNNIEIHLRGMGLGGWLLPEGYMLHTPGSANAAYQFRNKLIELMGEQKTNEFFELYRANYVNRKDIEALKSWGFNSIRLPMHYNLLTPKDQPYVYTESGFLMIDSLLSWCKDNELYLILDLHAAPGGQNDEGISDYNPNELSLWESEENKARTVALWKKLAERYVNEEWIAGYDMLNEPKWDLGPQNQPLRDLYIRITNAIREVDTNHIVFAEGNWYATDFSGLTPAWDNNMAYSFHRYWNSNSQSTIQYLIDIRNSENVPLWMGESGENSNQWFVEAINLLESNNIGWAWWPHKKFESIAGPLSAYINPEYAQILKYWNGQASKPSAAYTEAAMFKMADNLKIEKCFFRKDVIDAMFRQRTTNTTLPFTENNIPGVLFAVNYDLGKNNFAYKDNNYQNTGGGAYNNGYEFRNDGVDIEKCNDFFTNGYNVGWTETGEYLSFTINVEETGSYDMTLRTASNQSGGKILLRIDNQQVNSFIDIPVTGGWQTWGDVDAGSVYLTAGTHTLNISFYFGGFNFNYIEFVKGITDVNNEEHTVYNFDLRQNFPNPFNPTTKIKYSIPKVVDANIAYTTLTVFDVLGNVVSTLVNEVKSPGEYEVEFNAANLSSGIYFYQLKAGDFISTKKLTLLK